MPTDKLRPIELFPSHFQYPIKNGNGKYLLTTTNTEREALAMARRYRTFLKSLRLMTLHYLSLRMMNKSVKTKVSRDGEWWAVHVVVKDKFDFLVPANNSPQTRPEINPPF